MQKENKHIEQYSDLITSVLAGEADDLSIQKHEKFMLEDAEYVALFEQFSKIWEKVSLQEVLPEINIETEWNKIQSTLFNEDEKIIPISRKSPARFILRIAAILVVGLLAFVSYNYFGKSKYEAVVAENKIVKKELPDGSEVTLNYNSEIKYEKNYNEKNRNIKLQGDAFFKVKRDTANPFIVEAGNLMVEVLGTSFYVNAHKKGKHVEVIVESGVVAVYEKGKKENKTILKKGEKASFKTKEKKVLKIENQDINFLAWKTKELKFENQELNRIVYDLNRAYHSNISIKSDKIKDCRLTVNFDNKDLDAVLNILKEILDLKIKKKKDVIELKGKGCE